jgi:putative ABC transport system permease protein
MEMTLIEGDLRSIRPFPIQSGKWITPDPDIVLPVAVNEAASVNLGLTTGTVFSTRIGQTGERVIIRVVGVVADGTRDPHAYAPLDLRLSWVKQIAYRMVAPNILLHTDKAADLPALTELIRTEYFRIFDPGAFPGVMRMDQEDAYAETLGAIRLIFSVVAGLSLIVGAMGILNIGLATLRERSDELSLHRSFGATRAQVMAIIVLEGQIVAVSAAIAAVFFGLLSFPHVSAYLTQGLVITALSFPLSAAIIGISACCLAAFAGSLAPAVRAGRVPISSIMRI